MTGQLAGSAVLVTGGQSRAFKRDGLPEDVEGAVVFLSSADSAFMTGQTLVVDGGSMFA